MHVCLWTGHLGNQGLYCAFQNDANGTRYSPNSLVAMANSLLYITCYTKIPFHNFVTNFRSKTSQPFKLSSIAILSGAIPFHTLSTSRKYGNTSPLVNPSSLRWKPSKPSDCRTNLSN